MTESTIKNVFSLIHEEKDSTRDPLFLAELQLTRCELQYLIDAHGDKIVTQNTIKPFRNFLANRWKRISETDLIYPHAPTQAATRLCIQVAEIIVMQLCNTETCIINKEVDNKKLIYSYLMPNVDFSYRANMLINNLQLEGFVLTDDGESLISVSNTMLDAADRRSTALRARALRSDYRYETRLLTESERQRLLSHSAQVQEYYQAIEQSISLKTTSIGEVLEEFCNSDSRTDTIMMQKVITYLEGMDSAQKNNFYSMPAYCSHTCKNETFKEVTDYFGKSEHQIRTAHINLRAFINRHKFTLFAEKRTSIDPLILATPKFKEAMKHPIIVTATYGKTAREYLMDKIYDEKNFALMTNTMKNAKQLAHYLQEMPTIKTLLFAPYINDEKLMSLFNNPGEDDVSLATIWSHLSSSQKIYLVEHINNPMKFENILNRQSDLGKKADYKIAVDHLETILRSRDSMNNRVLPHLLAQINDVSRDMPATEFHFLTELVCRSALRLVKPSHSINNLRYVDMVDEIKERSWKRIILSVLVRICRKGLKMVARIDDERSYDFIPKEHIKLPSLAYNFFARSSPKKAIESNETNTLDAPLLTPR